VLYVHRSERADLLVETLGDVLAEPLADALATEVVAVPTRGVERWLSQRLSHRLGVGAGRADGVCANFVFPFPGTLVTGATARASGLDPAADPWPPERSVWPLLRLVDDHLSEPFLRSLAAHLHAASPGDTARRFATVRHLADLYDHYGVHRPDMIRAWTRGDHGDGPPSDRDPAGWQAELWRRLRTRIGVDSPAERLEAATARLSREPDLLDVPSRVSLFGLTRLPASHLAVLGAIADQRDVHLFLLHPSGDLWDAMAARLPHPAPGLARRSDPTAALPANPLLRSWGRDAREMQLVLAGRGAGGGVYRAVAGPGGSLLARIQADIRADRSPAGRPAAGGLDPRPVLDPADDSLRIHSCHGRFRQVEVMRDAILHLLAADPTLEPRDVIVMCPDIEHFAPLLHAAFGRGDLDDPGATGAEIPELRVRLADRSLRQTNPLLAVADLLLELADGRLTASQVLDLASREPVRRRFLFDDDDLSQLEQWVVEMGVRWGLDAAHRGQWGLPGLKANTWSAGLDRLLLGVAMADEDQRMFGGTVPLDDVASGTVDLAGRFAELVQRLGAAVDRLSGPQPIAAWSDAIAGSVEAVAAASPADAWQRDQLRRTLDEVVEEAGASATAARLDLAEIRALVGRRLQGRPTRANFRTGDLTVCTLVPMRSVPHRVVCLLGLDDGIFPRHTELDGDDLLLRDPWVGDRDARGEDRQLLLDAVLAATDHLIISFSGRDERTNRARPPAVPIAELLDVVDRTVVLGSGSGPAREAVVVHHPLQSFDPRNFISGGLAADGPWSFDPLNLEGATSLSGPRRERAAFLTDRLPPPTDEVVQLESLIRFVQHPVKAFLRERLGVYAGSRADEVDDDLPIELDALEKWAVGDRLLTGRLAGAGGAGVAAAELARGTLPPGLLATQVLDEVGPTVEGLVAAVQSLPCAGVEPESLEVNLRLPDGRLLVGTVPGVRAGTIVRCVYSSLGPKHRLAAWVRFLALSAARPELDVAAVTVGRGRRSRGSQLIRRAGLDPLGADAAARGAGALARLLVVIDLYDRGMREPLPIYCDTSAAWADGRRADKDPAERARQEWSSTFDFTREDGEPEHVLVFGDRAGFDELLTPRPQPDEHGPGWGAAEPTRLGRLACRLWDPLLDHERVEER
jgi:exodeoxyribonuclease V gamma subunit